MRKPGQNASKEKGTATSRRSRWTQMQYKQSKGRRAVGVGRMKGKHGRNKAGNMEAGWDEKLDGQMERTARQSHYVSP